MLNSLQVAMNTEMKISPSKEFDSISLANNFPRDPLFLPHASAINPAVYISHHYQNAHIRAQFSNVDSFQESFSHDRFF
jgi:hypothetical protein